MSQSKRRLTPAFCCVLLSASAFAQTPTDIAPGHWAAEAVRTLAAKGLVQGYPGGLFDGERPLTRYEMALVIQRLLKTLPEKPAAPGTSTGFTVVEPPAPAPLAPLPLLTENDKALLRRLASEFLPELAILGTDLKALRAKVDGFEKIWADLQRRVQDVQETQRTQQGTIESLRKFQISGYLQLRYDALFAHASQFRGGGSGGTGQRPTFGAPRIGGPSNGFLVRRGRLRAESPTSTKDGLVFQIDFASVAGMNLRDAWADVRSGLPRNVSLRIGQFPPPFSYVLPNTSRIREAPDRPIGFSDTSNSALIHKDTVSSLGGEFTPGSIVPLFSNQDRDVGLTFTHRGKRATTSFGWINGEGRDVLGQRALNSGVTFVGRVEQRIPAASGNLFVGVSRYDGGYSVRSAAPTGGVVAPFRYADREFTNFDTRWEGRDGWQARFEHLDGRFETTPDRALYIAGNRVEAWYATLRKDISTETALSLTWDVFRPTSQTLAGISPSDYARRTLQGGVLHWLAPRTRLRLWYVQALSAYDPSAAAWSRARGKVGQFIGEIQVEY